MESNKIKKIVFFFDSRATFSYSSNIIKVFNQKKIKYKTIISGNFLEKKFDINKDIFKKHKIKITKNIHFKSPNLKPSSWPISMGRSIVEYSKVLEKIKPDMIILTGDRIETLAMCITASYLNIRIAHVQAGDKSGHIDDLNRSAIAKFAHLHFASSNEACKRLLSIGEEKKRIFLTGAPQLIDIKPNKVNNFLSNYFIIIFHPVLNEIESVRKQTINLIDSIKQFKNYEFKWIFPNNDMGHNIILTELKKTKIANLKIIKNLERNEFIRMLSNSRGIIGNSSCGIIEASMFPIPVVNIGSRQNGRPQSKNILNTNYDSKNIIKNIKKITNVKNVSKLLKKTQNPYYKKNSNYKIFDLIYKFKKNNLIFKKF